MADYVPLNNIFFVIGNLTEPEDAGFWIVRVKLVYFETF